MIEIKRYFIEILSAAIRGEKIRISTLNDKDLEELYDIAVRHDVDALVYFALSFNKESLVDNNKGILNEFKKRTFFASTYQIMQINKVGYVLNEFNNEDIPVIALKGLQVREFYPKPEYRTMSDADLLIYKEDLDRIEKLLINLGYDKGEALSHHVVYNKPKYPNLELHWTVKNTSHEKSINDISDEAWHNTIDINVGNTRTLGLNYEYLLLYLITHIQAHIREGGFGVRQLCDIVVLMEKVKGDINWSKFKTVINKYNLYKFTNKIFNVCYILFNSEIPEGFHLEEELDSNEFKYFINEIIIGGVYGKKENYGAVDKIMFYSDDEKLNKNKYILRSLFPASYKLNKKYSYAINNKFLLPIAWIHRMINIMTLKDIKVTQVQKDFNEVYNKINEKTELIKWLEI